VIEYRSDSGWESGTKNWIERTNNAGTAHAAEWVKRQRHPEED
jgi:hypothetical protein